MKREFYIDIDNFEYKIMLIGKKVEITKYKVYFVNGEKFTGNRTISWVDCGGKKPAGREFKSLLQECSMGNYSGVLYYFRRGYENE